MTTPALTRETRLQAISLSDTERLVSLADNVLTSLNVTPSRGPAVGLLMVRVEEPSERQSFNFAEVTVSEAEVTAGDVRGYAMVLGREPEKALAGAILDVALETAHPAAPAIEACLNDALERERGRVERIWARVAPTIVRFEEMAP